MMNHNFYFDGRQIKNYLIGFASLFSEIPYKTRRGKLESVPIHYGSPSDIISYLEMNVDNEATKNRNRIKDISIPMFSFRMTGLERNPEKRRAPLDSITVDLRPLGYSTGYVAMKPAPIKFTMELICWASSDYQAFEISEQIIPYFNSPQQVSIEPLPRCPISTSEIFLENVEIDTEPESQKYSAMVTMSFTVNGWLLTQPRIWSTNMKFEFQMLDKDYQGPNVPVNLSDTDWSIGHEIIDTNDTPPPILPSKNKLNSIDDFIRNTTLVDIYGEKLDLYNLLVENNRISKENQLLDTTPLEITYKGEEKLIKLPMMELLIDDMEDIKFLFKNELLKDTLNNHTLRDDIKIFDMMIEDKTDILDVYLKLLDHNLVTKGFNRTEIPFSNSDKLNMFGSTRIDISDKLERLKLYLSSIENIKVKQPQLISSEIFNKEYKVYMFGVDSIPFHEFPETFKKINGIEVNEINKNIEYISTKVENNRLKIRIQLNENDKKEDELIVSLEKKNYTIKINKNLDETIDVELDSIPNTPNIISISPKNNLGFNPIGLLVIKNNEYPNFKDISFSFNNKLYSPNELDFIDDIDKLFDGIDFLNDRFINVDDYIVSTLLLRQLVLNNNSTLFEAYEKNQNKEIYEKSYNGSFYKMISDYGKLKDVIETIRENIDKLNPPKGINNSELNQKQTKISNDLKQTVTFDKNGKPIYDVNNDGFINKEDLKILGSDVDNPDDFDFVSKYGIWYKRFNPNKIPEERIKRIMQDLKIMFYLTEKNNMSELKDFVKLYDKKLLTTSFVIPNDEKKQKEIKSIGYNIEELDDKLLFMRLFVESCKNIMIKEKDFILHFVPDMNEESKRLLHLESGLEIDNLVIGKFIDQYFRSNLLNEEERLEDMKLFRKILSKIMKEYTNYSFQFDIFLNDIKKTELFIDSLEASTPWLSEKLPEVEKKIKEKYLKKTNK